MKEEIINIFEKISFNIEELDNYYNSFIQINHIVDNKEPTEEEFYSCALVYVAKYMNALEIVDKLSSWEFKIMKNAKTISKNFIN